jgi:hypothetical protein
MDFEQRLHKAIERGQRRSEEKAQRIRQKQLTEEELRAMHTKLRLELSEHIESCVESLGNQFPGFRYQSIYGDRGWGASCIRDDVGRAAGTGRSSYFSRLEMAIRPFSSLYVLELTAKGTIRNKEIFNRTHFQKLDEVDTDTFRELIDVWILEYAEAFAALS